MTKLLLVEDDLWLAELEASVLQKAGYEVVLAAHATSAIEAVDREQPDLIILDLLLTGSTGFALLHELRSYEDTKKVPIVICTNAAERLQPAELKAYGVQRIVDKSVMVPEDLVAAVRSVLA
jgi:CheY-like chemotaxis protein